MATNQGEEFKFPDEIEDKGKPLDDPKLEIEFEDDTPPEDRNRTPMPTQIVEKLDKDELDQYDGEVKEKMLQMRKVWHDERRAKEAAYREQQEAIALAKRVMEENKKIKQMLSTGEKEYVESLKTSADLQLKLAQDEYRKAYDAGDTDKIIESQQKMQEANIKVMQAKNFRMPSLQVEENSVQTIPEQPQSAPEPDLKAKAWQQRNPWFGQDEEMTASTLGLHEKLRRNGVVIGSDEYYAALDKTIRKRFPENFEDSAPNEPAKEAPRQVERPASIVAPAVRSSSPNRIKLKTSQVQLAKKLGLTPEQYAIAAKKLEKENV